MDSQSQHFSVPHGATRPGLPALAPQPYHATSQASTGNVPVIWLFSRYLRRRGSVARRAGHRGRGENSQVVQLLELAELGRDRADDLVALEVPATPRGGSRGAPGVGDAGGARRSFSFVSWPISGGIVPVIMFPERALRRRGAVARRAGRRGRGGNSQERQRREQADLDRDRALELVVPENPATPRVGRAPSRALETRGGLAALSWSRDRRSC